MNIAGMMAKYFATSFAIENVVSAPRVISSCLPISTISMSLVGLESRSTMLPASLAALVPVFIATPTSACASAGASLVPSPVIATIRPDACSRRMRASLSSGVAWAMKSSTPASAAIAAAVSGLSPVIITVLMPIARMCANRSRIPPFTMSFRCTTPSARPFSATASGVPPEREIRSTVARTSGGTVPPSSHDVALDGVGRALPDLPPVERDPRHACLRRERQERRVLSGEVAAADAELLGQDDNRAALRRLVRERRQLRRIGQRLLRHARRWQELRGLPVAERDRPGLVQEQRVDVARRLDRAPGHRQHVVLHQPVHARDADGRDECADRRRDEADEERDQDRNRDLGAGVVGKRLERHDDEQEDERQHGEQDVQGDLVRRLLPLAPSTSAIMRSRNVSPGFDVMRT